MNPQDWINLTLGIISLSLGVINQIQIRRQSQRLMRVELNLGITEAVIGSSPYGTPIMGPELVFTINAINFGLLPITLKGAGIKLPNGKNFSMNGILRSFPKELSPGSDEMITIQVAEVLKILSNGSTTDNSTDEIILKGYFDTSLKGYQSKNQKFSLSSLQNQVERIRAVS